MRMDLNGDSAYFNNTSIHDAAIENDSFLRLSRMVERTPQVRLMSDRELPQDAIHVNSIAFEGDDGTYVLTILPETHRVDVAKLQQVTRSRNKLKLCAADRLCRICGFAPGTVPPLIGLSPLPILTVIDASLLVKAIDETVIYGGGGHPDMSCVMPLNYLVNEANVITVDIAVSRNNADQSTNALLEGNCETYKPFFSVEPPCVELSKQILNNPEAPNPLQTIDVTIVGRLMSVRKMARCLIFGDLGPPNLTPESSASDPLLYPWRCPKSGIDMAVQIIAGQTLLQRLNLDSEEGAHVIRRLKPGQLLLIEARTNVKSSDSLRNWVLNQTLDLVVYSYQILSTLDDPAESMVAKSLLSKQAASVLGIRPRPVITPSNPEDMDETVYLQLQDIYEPEKGQHIEEYYRKHILVVDNLENVQQFSNELSQMLLQLTTQNDRSDSDPNVLATGLIGLDCEWLPSFYTLSRHQPQPVLLLQISLHPLKKVYLLDLQALLRPLQSTSTPMNPLEEAVAQVLGDMLTSQRLIKTGFQVVHDLRQLAASYPHIVALQTIHSVLESSVLAKRVMHINKQRHARTATSSLSRMCETFLGKALQKDEQCSNWSARPLTMEQIEYAALDAVVTPILTELLMKAVNADFFDHPQVGRWKDDRLFLNTLVSWRFLFLDSDTDAIVIRKLNAKRVVGDHFVVNQHWSTGDDPLSFPSVPSEMEGDRPYTDREGILRYPSHMISIDLDFFDKRMDSLIGAYVGKSKDRCVMPFLQIPEGAKLDFQQRSGLIETENAFFLFVNMPQTPGRGQPRSFPNEWLEDGQILTWFIRQNQWQSGTTSMAKKLLSTQDEDSPTTVSLFVRVGKGAFLCCGRCRVVSLPTSNMADGKEEWNLVRLHLMLLDWPKLYKSHEFRELVRPGYCQSLDSFSDSDSEGVFE